MTKMLSRQYASNNKRHAMQISEKSTMMTTVGEKEDLLNKAKEIATQRWELYGHHVYETIVFDGPVID